jgi:hypothetical protein
LAKPRITQRPLLRLRIGTTRLLRRHGLTRLILLLRGLLLRVAFLLLARLICTISLNSQLR